MSEKADVAEEEIQRIFFGFKIEAQRQLTSQLEESQRKALIIAGPTAVGKTAFAIELAEILDGEIVSADSMQVYRGMDIGTAKASTHQQERVLHHLLNIKDINEPFNVVDFYYEARQACQNILARNRVPIIVGGSGFYLHSLVYGPPSGPPSVPEVRKAIEEEIELLGSDALYKRLKELDPQYASSITKHDKQKIVRALEIITLSGKKVSRLNWRGRKKPQGYNFRCWFLHRPKEHLYKVIDKRCEEMLANGFLEEVERLLDLGLLNNSSASQAIGYRQAIDYLASDKSQENLDTFLKDFQQASRHYAKRQFTWFRREPLFRWLDLDLHDPEVAREIIRRDYEES